MSYENRGLQIRSPGRGSATIGCARTADLAHSAVRSVTCIVTTATGKSEQRRSAATETSIPNVSHRRAAILESRHAQLHDCLLGCRRGTVHVRIFDRQHAVLHVSPSPPPAEIVGPSFHVKPDRWLLPRALDLHPRLVLDVYWMAITTQWLLVCHRQREPQPDGCGREPTSARHRLLARSSRSVGLRRLDRRDRIVFGYFECRERFVVRRSRRSFRRCQLADLVFESHPVSSRHGTTVQFDEEIYVVRIAQCICDGVEGEPNAAECVHHQSRGEGELAMRIL